MTFAPSPPHTSVVTSCSCMEHALQRLEGRKSRASLVSNEADTDWEGA